MNFLTVTPELTIKSGIAPWIACLFNGKDVASRCVYANEETGEVVLCKLDKNGKRYLDENREVAKENLVGKVEIKLKQDAPKEVVQSYRMLRGKQ